MRTKLKIDDDIQAELEEVRRRTGLSLNEIVNQVLRSGLESMEMHPSTIGPFIVEARPMGLIPGLDYANTAELLEGVEGPRHR